MNNEVASRLSACLGGVNRGLLVASQILLFGGEDMHTFLKNETFAVSGSCSCTFHGS